MIRAITSIFKKPLVITLLITTMTGVLSVLITKCKFQSPDKSESNTNASYVGSAKCQVCHQKEWALYGTSDHFHAMDSALPRSVRGDFNNSFFVYFGDTSFFYQREGKYYVRTKDSSGLSK